ncbi:MAG: DNA primase [Spirochaetales bacterium]|nr:DNA primase [Spirochaetales bacterium]
MRIPDDKLQEITDKVDILEVVGSYVSLKKAGRAYIGLCPFHNEKTPSFNVNAERKFFHCFGCGKGGSVFKFLMEIEGLTFPEAVEKLADKTGVVINKSASTKEDGFYKAMFDLYTRVSGSFQYMLKEVKSAEKARKYLTARGVSQEMIELFNVGYAPDDRYWLFKFLSQKNFSPAFLEKSGLFTHKNPKASLFWDRIIFPITNPTGATIGFGGRALREGAPKYMNSPESQFFLKRKNLYGLSQGLQDIRKSGEFILVEGYLDVIAFFQAGIPRAVAPLGTAFTEDQARVMRRYCEKGIILFDGDDAGSRAAMKAVHICETVGIKSKVISLPPGMDPADILKKDGPEALHNVLKSTINNFDYLVGKALEGKNPDNPEDKEAILNDLKPFLDGIESQVRREGLIRKLSEVLIVDYRSIESDLNRSGRRIGSVQRSEKIKVENISKELYLMLATVTNQEQFSYVRDKLKLEDFEDPKARLLYIALEERYRAGEGNSLVVLEQIDDPDLQTLLTARMTSGEFNVNPEDVIRQSVVEVRRESMQRARKIIEKKLQENRSRGGDLQEEQRLLSDKMYLDNRIRETEGDG